MSARETNGRDIHTGRGRVAAPTRFFNSNPEALTLRDIPAVLKPGEQPQQTAKPHFATPQQPQFAAQPITQPRPQPQQLVAADNEPTVDVEMLARQRTALGFDDIPIVSAEELENEKDLREKVSSWAKEAYQHGLSPEKRQRFTKFIKDKEFLAWKDDLKWALKADKGDEPLESIKPAETPTQQTPQPPANVAADPTQPRPVRVPQRGTQFAAGLRAQTRLQQQIPQPMTPATAAGSKSIDINISFGSLPKLPKLPKLPDVKPLLNDIRHLKWNRRTQITSGVAIIFLLFVAPHFLPGGTQKAATVNADGSVKTEQVAQKPDYHTIVPQGKTASDVTWQRVSPPDHNAVFAYADKIAGTTINVSQQPIPDNFKSDVDGSVQTLAKSYNATEKIIAGTTSIYVGTSGDGPQSAIFTKNNLLILVKSTDKISEADWAKYAESLN